MEKNVNNMEGWLCGGDVAFYADRGEWIVRANGTILQKAGKQHFYLQIYREFV